MICSAIIPAGGVGKRLGGDLPKQFTELNGVPMIVHTLKIFENTPGVESIVIPVHSDWYRLTHELVEKNNISKVREIVIGGKTRQESVANALHTKTAQESEIVLVHEAVRPLASTELVGRVIESAEEYGAVVPGIATNDVIKERTGNGAVVRTFEKSKLCRIQAPQGFWTDLILTAYRKANEVGYVGPDSASLLEFIGYKVQVIDGEDANIKIMTPLDRKFAEMVLNGN